MITARTAVNDAETGPYLKTLAMIDSAIGQPRLSIIHLLGWTACTAIVLALGRWIAVFRNHKSDCGSLSGIANGRDLMIQLSHTCRHRQRRHSRRLTGGPTEPPRCWSRHPNNWALLCHKAPELMAQWHFDFRHEFRHIIVQSYVFHRHYGDERQKTNL
jgi:hypothetical protein